MTSTRGSSKPTSPEAVLAHIEPGADIVMPNANGEPVELVDTLEEHAEELRGVRIHQMQALRERRYINGEFGDHLRYVSYFLSPASRKAYLAGQCDLMPNHFSEVPDLLRRSTKCSLVIAAASPPNRHGYFSLGTNCDYTASLIGRAPFFLEANAQMPRTFGGNQVHISQVAGWTEVDYPLIEAHPVAPTEKDRAIAALVAERIPDGATIQAGIGGMPNALLAMLGGPSRARRPHRVALRRGHRPGGSRRRHRNPEGAAPREGRRHLRPRLAAALRLPARELRRGLRAGGLGERPARDRPGAELRRDQCDDRGRLLRTMRLGDRGRTLFLLERRAVRLRSGGDVLRWGAGLSSSCKPRHATARCRRSVRR